MPTSWRYFLTSSTLRTLGKSVLALSRALFSPTLPCGKLEGEREEERERGNSRERMVQMTTHIFLESIFKPIHELSHFDILFKVWEVLSDPVQHYLHNLTNQTTDGERERQPREREREKIWTNLYHL